ncbi:unnamed protein product [Urochloa decumbens]|uniref:Essential protein Yae1 N-terminal domain-containing protein n=1 Tax=Urochloa decumbens TaxID=240449 RepID=A0ABC8YK08_9POAL
MAGPGDAEGVTASMGELRVEAAPSSSGTGIAQHANGGHVAAAEDDDIWDDASDSPGHASNLDREWIHRQNQFHKMGYRDGITEGQKDSAQEGFNVGFRQSVNVGYKWGLVRGVTRYILLRIDLLYCHSLATFPLILTFMFVCCPSTSALASLPDNLKEKLVPDAQCRRKFLDVHSSVQEISADDALQMFHESIFQSNHPADGATESNRIKSLSEDVVLLLHECPDIKVSEELA